MVLGPLQLRLYGCFIDETTCCVCAVCSATSNLAFNSIAIVSCKIKPWFMIVWHSERTLASASS